MPASLIATLNGLVNRRLTSAAGEGIAEPPEAAGKALQLWFSALVAGLTRQSGDGAVISAVAALVGEPALSGGMLSRVVANAKRIVEVPAQPSIVQFPPQPRPLAPAPGDPAVVIGQRFVALVLGERREALTRTVSALAGVDHDKAGRLLGLAAPMVLAALGHRLSGGEIGGAQLGAVLGLDRMATLAAVPAELTTPLGWTATDIAAARPLAPVTDPGVFRTAIGRSEPVVRRDAVAGAAPVVSVAPPMTMTPARVPDVAPATTTVGGLGPRAGIPAGPGNGGRIDRAVAAGQTPPTTKPAPGIDGWASLLPSLIALGLVALVGWLTWPQSPQLRAPMPPSGVSSPSSTPGTPARPLEASEPRRTISVLRTLPNGQSITIPSAGFEAKLLGVVDSRWSLLNPTQWLTVEGLNFETGSAEITADSRDIVQRLAEVMKAYPTLRIKIGGYTDNQGDAQANQLLSENRARAVRFSLREQGIPADRMETEGFGDRDPIADNSTAEGRARNRRISVLVLAR